MFILRSALPARTRRRHRHPCHSCAAAIHAFEAWCPFCVRRNPHFSQDVFKMVAKCTLEDALGLCRLDPSHELERLQYASCRRHRPTMPPLAGCALCGTLLNRPLAPG